MGSHTETFNAHEAVCVYDKTQGIEVPFQGPESVTIDDITKDVTLNGQPVRKFEWDKAMGGTFWKFNIVGWQLLELTVPDVILDDGNGDKANFKYRLGLSYKWKSGTKGIETLLKDQGGRDPTPLLIQAARADLKVWSETLPGRYLDASWTLPRRPASTSRRRRARKARGMSSSTSPASTGWASKKTASGRSLSRSSRRPSTRPSRRRRSSSSTTSSRSSTKRRPSRSTSSKPSWPSPSRARRPSSGRQTTSAWQRSRRTT
mmetsp:Transcript_16819/g.50931  ORF Transcript_16819/g.50931 Transcript_16819/m.50931 type:complete len:261 (+) Transcript_16819:119-901(+)